MAVVDVVPDPEHADTREHEEVKHVIEAVDLPVAVAVLQFTTQSVMVWDIAHGEVEVVEAVVAFGVVDLAVVSVVSDE